MALARPNAVHPSNVRSALDENRRALLQVKRARARKKP
jgi:hypothetical protein